MNDNINDLQNEHFELDRQLDDALEDLNLVSEYLQHVRGCDNVASVLSDGYRANPANVANPNVSRNQLFMLRCSAFAILHSCSYTIIKGYQEFTNRSPTMQEVHRAVQQIMDVENTFLPRACRHNWINLYTYMAKIAKERLPVRAYSTEMPIAHIYLYSHNLNKWANQVFGVPSVVSYDQAIEDFYGQAVVQAFDFQAVVYSDIIGNFNQPLITNYM